MKKEILAFVAAGALVFTLAGCSSAPTEDTTSKSEATTEPAPSTQEKEKAASEEPSMTPSQKNAVAKAKSYLDVTGFSYTGLIGQLEFEKFSPEDATYGADNCGADWNEQAAKKAAEYLDITAFSRDGLIEQLEFEGFTPEEAAYGADSAGL